MLWHGIRNLRHLSADPGLAAGLTDDDKNHLKTFTMRRIPNQTSRLMDVRRGSSRILLIILAALLAAPVALTAETDKADSQVSLTVTSLERVQQYPPPPAPPKVFVVSAGAGHELAVITLKVEGSVAFDDYRMSAGASLVDSAGNRQPAVLSKPFKAGSQPEVWDRHVLVFSVKKGLKLKSLLIGEMSFDLSKA